MLLLHEYVDLMLTAWPCADRPVSRCTRAAGVYKWGKLMGSSSHVAARQRRLLLAAAGFAAFTLALGLLPAADAATTDARYVAPSGSSYVGEAGGGHVALVLSRDGRQVTRAFVGYWYKCSDGTGFSDIDVFRAIPMSANRAFRSTYDTGPQADPRTPGGRIQFTGLFAGKKNKRGTKVIGTARFTVEITRASGEVEKCDTGTIRYTAKD